MKGVLGRLPDIVERALRRLRTGYAPSKLMISVTLALFFTLLVTSVIAHYFGVDVIGSISYVAIDVNCFENDPASYGIGMHCFGDYYQVAWFVQQSNPWDAGSNYLPAGMLIPGIFNELGGLFGSPRVGLVLYLFAAVLAVCSPAIWATRGRSISHRFVIAGVFGLLSIPALNALDRGNVVAFAVPALLAFLVGLGRERYDIVMIAILLATMIKPQFVVLVVVIFALRRWLQAIVICLAIAIGNLLPYLFWPRDLPSTIAQSAYQVLRFGSGRTLADGYPANVSFGKGVYEVDHLMRLILGLPLNEWLARYGGLVGMVIGAAILVAILVTGGRIPPLITGIVLLACASLSPGTTFSYYLVFALAVMAVLLRDPARRDGALDRHGVLDGPPGARMRSFAVGAVAVAVALSLTRILLPIPLRVDLAGAPTHTDLVLTLGPIIPVSWLVAVTAVLVGWLRPAKGIHA